MQIRLIAGLAAHTKRRCRRPCEWSLRRQVPPIDAQPRAVMATDPSGSSATGSARAGGGELATMTFTPQGRKLRIGIYSGSALNHASKSGGSFPKWAFMDMNQDWLITDGVFGGATCRSIVDSLPEKAVLEDFDVLIVVCMFNGCAS